VTIASGLANAAGRHKPQTLTPTLSRKREREKLLAGPPSSAAC